MVTGEVGFLAGSSDWLYAQSLLVAVGKLKGHQGMLCVSSRRFTLAILRLTEEKEKPFVEKHLSNS